MSDITAQTGEALEPAREPTRWDYCRALNQRLASKCFSFGGVALLSLFLLFSTEECDNNGGSDPPPADNGGNTGNPPPNNGGNNQPPADNTDPGCDPPGDGTPGNPPPNTGNPPPNQGGNSPPSTVNPPPAQQNLPHRTTHRTISPPRGTTRRGWTPGTVTSLRRTATS